MSRFKINQIKNFYITSFLKNQTYFTPILILFLQFHHLTFQEIFWVFTIGSIFSFIIEIPTGVIADLFGKRRSIRISKFGIFVSFIVFGFSHSFWMFVVAQLLFELGNSFRSGTETAYVFDYLKQNKGAPSYTEVKGKQKFWARLGESIAALTGGFLAVQFGYNAVFFFAAVPAFLNFILSLLWLPIKERTGNVSLRESFHMAKSSLCDVACNSSFLRITLNITVFTGALAALQKFIQPYMVDVGLPVEWFGVTYAIFLAIAAFFVRYSYKVEQRFGAKRTINALSLFAVVPVFILGFNFVSIIGVFLFFIVVIVENFRSPIANKEFHEHASSEKRATLGSILSLSKSLGKIAVLPLIGYVADVFTMYIAILCVGVILLVNGLFFYIRAKKPLAS